MEKLKPDDPTHIGPYAIIGVLGEGGMGRVYLGHKNGKLAAIKVMVEQFANVPGFRTRFRREVEAVQKIKRDFTARVLDSGSVNGQLWYASEYVSGLTLAEAVQIARFTGVALEQFAYSLYKALMAIHDAGVIHRDLKPSNIILGPNGVRVVDFGIASIEDAPALTMTSELLGTASYMSPEQVVGGKPDPKWDVFSYGSVLTFAATGRPPYSGTNRNAIMVAIANPAVQPNLDDVPAKMQTLVRHCLQQEISNRASTNDIYRYLPKTHAAAAAGTTWMPAAVTVKVQEATRVMTKLEEELAPTRKYPAPGPKPRPVVRTRNRTGFMKWAGAVTAIAIVLGLAGTFDGDTETLPTPAPTTSRPATVDVSRPAFKASKLIKEGNLAVTKVVADNRELHLTVIFNGTAEQRAAAVAKSCLKGTYSERSQVHFVPDVSNEDTPGDVIEFRSALDFPGNFYFFPKCPKGTSVMGGQWLGHNEVPNDGFFGDEKSLLPVVDAYTKGAKLKVVLPKYATYDTARYKAICLKTANGVARPVSVTEAVNRKRGYVVLTYNHKQGTIYLKCGGKRTSYTGKGTLIP